MDFGWVVCLLQRAFTRLDVNGDGHINLGELKHVLCRKGNVLTEDECEEMFALADTDRNGEIDVNEPVNPPTAEQTPHTNVTWAIVGDFRSAGR